ncbi:ATP-binding cassette, subfamily F, uup [Albimonas donghaensis]|uniref:ATP-binding cassette, subfamily F, uup n=1 Tax=Albimonas donghaensis TaxID=356660 RepID=A0A1H2S1K6_9RHOB|nr:ATP-binding cassette domain-containing protein [Albimonas donghaensis]SDW24984.1 ATP-binding cassette, subfamily F, uup [Albimonas donghaensis]
MAEPPILTLSEISLGWGGDPLFAGLDCAVQPGDRICLVGRNGSGKSTLMKIMAGLAEPDSGERFTRPGATVGYLPQDPDFAGYATLGDYVAEPLDPAEVWRAEMAMEGLKVPEDQDPAAASGGERRRAALARLMAVDPDLMLLDEPTNHLDIEAIAWLEQRLSQTRAAFVLVSHDRAFLRALTRQVIWVDRGQARRLDRGFTHFEDWRDKVFEEEAQARHKLDRLIKQEAVWAVEGISARRKRNMGRVRRLQDLREERSGQRARTGTAAMAFDSAPQSGKRVMEAEDVSKSYGGKAICTDFSLKIMRGDCVAFVGPNGVGKSTMIKMLTGEVEPDAGKITLGTNLEVAVFDQARAALDPEMSLWDSLVGDPEMSVSGRSDQVMVRGRPKHVVAYLKDFLFDERQARGPVKSLSGGEKARLLLARLMARESNVLVLDEPTNDLDVETLDLLQELVVDFEGAVLLVSHDRDFLDRTAASTVVMEGDGRATVYAGGWSDMVAQRGGAPMGGAEVTSSAPRTAKGTGKGAGKNAGKNAGRESRKAAQTPDAKPAASSGARASKPSAKPGPKLTFTQTHRLEALPAEMERLGVDIGKLERLLADPDLYAKSPDKFAKATAALTQRRRALEKAEEEWLDLEALREAAEG